MSCWVVPSIAAEIWAVPLHQIMERMKSGELASKTESGFTFVDVAPDSPTIEVKPVASKPPTYTVVTHEEISMLVGDERENEESLAMGDWRSARNDAQMLRRPPIAA